MCVYSPVPTSLRKTRCYTECNISYQIWCLWHLCPCPATGDVGNLPNTHSPLHTDSEIECHNLRLPLCFKSDFSALYWLSSSLLTSESLPRWEKRETETWYQPEGNWSPQNRFHTWSTIHQITLLETLEPRQRWANGRQDHALIKMTYLCIHLAFYVSLTPGPQRWTRGVTGPLCPSPQCDHIK